jgi:hypothetical protein
VKSSAGLSRCKRYRYWLKRRWDDGPEVTFIGLNPSTADANTDDPTLRRIMGFSHEWGFSAVTVINLFAWRSRYPKALLSVTDPVGPRNNYWIKKLCQGTKPVVAAWGNGGDLRARNQYVLTTIPELYCLGKTGRGHPRHPLYAPANCRLIKVDKATN